MKDTITGMMLVLAMVAFFAITISWIRLWDSIAKALTPDEARRIESNIAKLSGLLGAGEG